MAPMAQSSKRHGALGVDAYRAIGYLPAALRNYLVRLGWSHGDDEIMSTEQMIEWFDVKDINKGAARFDFQKLEAINGLYMRSSDDQALFDALVAVLPEIEGGKGAGRSPGRQRPRTTSARYAGAEGARKDAC